MLKCPTPTPVTDRKTLIELMEKWLHSPPCPPSHLLLITLSLGIIEKFYFSSPSQQILNVADLFFFLPAFDTSRLQRGDLARGWGPFPWQLLALSLYIRAEEADSGSARKCISLLKINIILFSSTGLSSAFNILTFVQILSLWLFNLYYNPHVVQLQSIFRLKWSII